MNSNNLAVLLHAITGPIVMITVGVLFAIDHAGGYSFGRTWPVLIIVVGLLKLAERAMGQPRTFGNPGGGAA